MTAEDMVQLIEEMIEIKVRQQATATAKNLGMINRNMARVVFESGVADRERMKSIKQALVQLLEGSESAG